MICRFRLTLLCMLLTVSIAIVGCGSSELPHGTIVGMVYVGEDPLPFGEITFVDTEGNKKSSPVRNGYYQLKSISPGTWKIGVASLSQAFPGQKSPGTSPFPGKERPAPPAERFIPPHYKDPDLSGLSYTVHKGEQKHDIRLPPHQPAPGS